MANAATVALLLLLCTPLASAQNDGNPPTYLETGGERKLDVVYKQVSGHYLSADSPPLLMIQGDSDTTIPVKHAKYMKEKADAAKAPVEIMIILNAGHNWREVGQAIEPTREVIVERTVQFFVNHLQK